MIRHPSSAIKLLIATDFPPDAPGGGPAVIRQMLRGFPGEVHWWSCRPSVRGSSFMVRGSESWQGGGSAEVAGGGWRVAGFEVASFACCPPGKLMPARKWTRLKAWLMEHVWAPRAAQSLRQTIDRVQPDAIWMIPHDFSIFPLEKILNDESRISDDKKIRVHVTIQDFPDCHGHGKLWGEKRVERMARMQECIYAAAETADATSHPMLEELERRMGRRGLQMLHQGLETEDFKYLESLVATHGTHDDSPPASPHPPLATRHSRPIRIAYAGTILCEPEFALFVNLLEKLRHQSSAISHQSSVISHPPSAIELHLYGAHSYADRPWFQPWIIEHGNFPERELLAELRQCDWGFIPMSLHDDDPRYNRFSFPTKFITYLAAGLPPIVMGHPDSSVMKMAESYNVGIQVASDELRVAGASSSFQALGSSLSPETFSAFQYFSLPTYPSRINSLEAVLACARSEFDAEKMRLRLWGAFEGKGV